MLKYKRLNLIQCSAVEKLAAFFSDGPGVASVNKPYQATKDPKNENEDKENLAQKGYKRVTDLWTPEQKAEIDQHEESVERGYKEYSAY